MPLEIRELVIKASVSEGEQAQPSDRGGTSKGASDRDSIITACVERVLAILKERSER